MEILVYLSALILGFFVSGYMAVGFETGVELTYPETEFNSSGVLNSVSQTTGGLFTLLFTYILEITNDFWTNICMVVLLVIGTILTAFTKNVRKRQDALQQHKSVTENKAAKY
ncbi:uncharacterized MFS-type transporter C09D4.1-like [Chrysoperla carnea]|uniref:uncharacterized MFS-type transporter C09D4.1-like n=1 Tax=Chrysoperla carnea TaxID=189513 RepID=UPI001D0758D1|nr:uncharacterized MFS-type transporter C09D4.1-like [Chrysoperla carnea]